MCHTSLRFNYLWTKCNVLDPAEDGRFKFVMLLIVGCISCVAICAAIALCCYVVMRVKSQPRTAGQCLLSVFFSLSPKTVVW